jgi:hypothetical protein
MTVAETGAVRLARGGDGVPPPHRAAAPGVELVFGAMWGDSLPVTVEEVGRGGGWGETGGRRRLGYERWVGGGDRGGRGGQREEELEAEEDDVRSKAE